MKKFSEEDILDLLGNLPNQPSKYQMNFYSDLMNTDFNLNINAVAGSGKTTTIVNSLRLIPLNKRVIFLAFNNSIVDELKNRCPSHVQVTTIHSLGWRKSLDYYEKIDLIEGKVWNWCKKILKYKIPKVLQAQYFNTISQVVNLMRCDLVESFEEIKTLMEKHGILLSDNQIEDVMSIYELVKEDTTTFDFCDMIFQPAIETAIRFSKYDYVFVDEAQDLNRAQHKLIEKLIGTQTRLVSVGDPFQAIYSFAGADAESFEYFKNRPNTKNLPLSISYRCAKNIVLKAQELVPHIEYSENARLGTARDGSVSEIQEGDFVLCRNVMPLVLLCVEFMRRGKRARIKGSADMVKKISSLLELIDEPNYRKAVEIGRAHV